MKSFILLISVVLSCFAVDARMKIEKDVDQRARVAVVDCSDEEYSITGQKIFEIARDDLRISGHFIPGGEYMRASYASREISPSLRSMAYIFRFRFFIDGGKTILRLKVQSASDGKIVMEREYSVSGKERFPFLVHKAVSDANDALGFAPISWINRYIVFSKSTGKKESEIVLADYTFNYMKTIVKGGLNLFPRWGDKKQKVLYYTGYNGEEPVLYRQNLATGEREAIVSSQGMLICSDISADGKRLLLTMAPEGQADIFEYDLIAKRLTRLTKFKGIDVGGKYTNDEKAIVFVSNRMGYANIFRKSISDGSVEQIVFHGKNNGSCDVFGSKVVYSSRESESGFGSHTFNLYLADIDSGSVRPLTSNGVNQFPRFSMDGSVVLYIKRDERGTSVGYIGLETAQSMLFPLKAGKIQSYDW